MSAEGGGRGGGWWWVAAGMAAVLVVLALWDLTDREVPSPRTYGRSNLKMVSVALEIYAADYDDVLPRAPDQDTLKAVLEPYLKDEQLWKTRNPHSTEFEMNPALGGVNMTAVKDPERTLLLLDPARWEDGTRMVSFLNSRTAPLRESEWKAFEPTLHLRLPQTPFLPSVRHGYKPRSKTDER